MPEESPLLKDHTCGNEPNKDGRIISDCSKCYDDAFLEGSYLGKVKATNDVAAKITEMIRKELDPLNEDDQNEAARKWETARSLISIVERIRHQTHKEYLKNHSDHLDQHLRRVMTEEELAVYLEERKIVPRQ